MTHIVRHTSIEDGNEITTDFFEKKKGDKFVEISPFEHIDLINQIAFCDDDDIVSSYKIELPDKRIVECIVYNINI